MSYSPDPCKPGSLNASMSNARKLLAPYTLHAHICPPTKLKRKAQDHTHTWWRFSTVYLNRYRLSGPKCER
jgi:hypothetical protein